MLAIRAHKELPLPTGVAEQFNLQAFVPLIILDRNSQVSFHNSMETEELTNINRATV
jgi:hypothetical protein